MIRNVKIFVLLGSKEEKKSRQDELENDGFLCLPIRSEDDAGGSGS